MALRCPTSFLVPGLCCDPRAAAVVQAPVTACDVTAARHQACGNGPGVPLTSNDAGNWRARNRRVELVKPKSTRDG